MTCGEKTSRQNTFPKETLSEQTRNEIEIRSKGSKEALAKQEEVIK
jgi:hypothetical protein